MTLRGGNPKFPAAAIRVPQHEHSAGSKFLDKAKETAAAGCPGPARCRVLAADRGGRAVGTAAVSASWFCCSHLQTFAQGSTAPKGDSHENRAEHMLGICPAMPKFKDSSHSTHEQNYDFFPDLVSVFLLGMKTYFVSYVTKYSFHLWSILSSSLKCLLLSAVN